MRFNSGFKGLKQWLSQKLCVLKKVSCEIRKDVFVLKYLLHRLDNTSLHSSETPPKKTFADLMNTVGVDIFSSRIIHVPYLILFTRCMCNE